MTKLLTKLPKSGELHHRIIETVTNEEENIGFDKEIPKQRWISWKKTESHWWYKINTTL